MSETLTDLTT